MSPEVSGDGEKNLPMGRVVSSVSDHSHCVKEESVYLCIQILRQWPVARPSGHGNGNIIIEKLKIKRSRVEA